MEGFFVICLSLIGIFHVDYDYGRACLWSKWICISLFRSFFLDDNMICWENVFGMSGLEISISKEGHVHHENLTKIRAFLCDWGLFQPGDLFSKTFLLSGPLELKSPPSSCAFACQLRAYPFLPHLTLFIPTMSWSSNTWNPSIGPPQYNTIQYKCLRGSYPYKQTLLIPQYNRTR